MPNWKDNGWRKSDGSEVKNAREFQDLDNSINRYGMDVQMEHVRGHGSNRFNNEADRLARHGAQQNRRY